MKQKRGQKLTYINITNWSMTNKQMQYNGDKIVSLTNDVGTNGHHMQRNFFKS